jgi:hypothetical protein
MHAGVRVREARGALLRRQPRHGHQGSGQGLFFPAREGQGDTSSPSLFIHCCNFINFYTTEWNRTKLTGKRSPVPTGNGERVPAHDRGCARALGGDDAQHTRCQGGEQQVLRLRPLQMRRRKGSQ